MSDIFGRDFGRKNNIQINCILKATGFCLSYLMFILSLVGFIPPFSLCSARQMASEPQPLHNKQVKLPENKSSHQWVAKDIRRKPETQKLVDMQVDDAEIRDKKLNEIETDEEWQKNQEAFAKLFFGQDLSVRSPRKKSTFLKKKLETERVIGTRIEWPAKFGIDPGWLSMDKKGRSVLAGITGNTAIYALFGTNVTGWICLRDASRYEGTKEIKWWEMTWGIPPQSNLLLKMELKTVVPIILKSGMLVIYVEGSDLQIETSSPKCDWPPYNEQFSLYTLGFSTHQEVRLKSGYEFQVKVGLRSDGKGRDVILPALGTASFIVPKGKYDIYFQYSVDPTSLYKGDSFQLENHGVKIELGGAVDGNYSIQRVE